MGGKISNITRKTRRFNLEKTLKVFSKVKIWQLAMILVPLLFIYATLLRFDHLKMVDLRQAVLDADASGDEAEITRTLNDLKQFTDTHTIVNIYEQNGIQKIAFGTGEFSLSRQYERTVAALIIQAQESVGTDANPNGNVFEKAMSVCQPLAQQNGWTWQHPDYIACYQTEINKYPTSDRIVTEIAVDLPSPALYRYDFASPVWAPVPSGWVALICLALILFILVRFIFWLILRIAILIVH